MRLGCLGCLFLIAIIAGLLIAGAGVLLFSTAIFSPPENPLKPHYTASDGHRAQQKLAEIVLRERLLSRGTLPIVITQQELNAFLANHLEESEKVPLRPLAVRLTPGTAEIQGQIALKDLLAGLPFSLLGEYLPQSYSGRLVWITLQGRVKIEKRAGYFDILDASLGSQPVPSWLFSLMLGQKGRRLLQWKLPASVERIVVEEGRIVVNIRPRSSGLLRASPSLRENGSARADSPDKPHLEVVENLLQKLAFLWGAVSFGLLFEES